jgi:hypothetical protein
MFYKKCQMPKNYASGFRLVWDMNQRLVAFVTGKEGSAQAK